MIQEKTQQVSDLTKDERSLLLFFEAMCADYGGLINTQHMNNNDFAIAKRWTEIGFATFSRVGFKYITGSKTHCVTLSDSAWDLAHQERKARYQRIYSKKEWYSTKELQEQTD